MISKIDLCNIYEMFTHTKVRYSIVKLYMKLKKKWTYVSPQSTSQLITKEYNYRVCFMAKTKLSNKSKIKRQLKSHDLEIKKCTSK